MCSGAHVTPCKLMESYSKVFRQAEKDFYSLVSEITSIVSQKDPTIPELPVKDIIFRTYRDVRFSKDPTPYKTYFSVAWSRTGRKGPYAHYYLHIAPNNNSFLGTNGRSEINWLDTDVDKVVVIGTVNRQPSPV